MNVNELLREKRQEILHIAERHGAYNVRIFGSVVRGQAGPESDVDMLVEFKHGRNLFDRIGLKQDMEDLLDLKVDVLTEKSLHWHIRDQVIRQAVAL